MIYPIQVNLCKDLFQKPHLCFSSLLTDHKEHFHVCAVSLKKQLFYHKLRTFRRIDGVNQVGIRSSGAVVQSHRPDYNKEISFLLLSTLVKANEPSNFPCWARTLLLCHSCFLHIIPGRVVRQNFAWLPKWKTPKVSAEVQRASTNSSSVNNRFHQIRLHTEHSYYFPSSVWSAPICEGTKRGCHGYTATNRRRGVSQCNANVTGRPWTSFQSEGLWFQ